MSSCGELPTVLLQQEPWEEPQERTEETNADRMKQGQGREGRSQAQWEAEVVPGPVGSFPQDPRPLSELWPRWPGGVGASELSPSAPNQIMNLIISATLTEHCTMGQPVLCSLCAV